MSGVLSACGLALLGVFSSLILSSMGFRGARLACVGATVALLIAATVGISDVIRELGWIGEAAGIGEAARMALKVVGIGYVAGICHDVCLDMGEGGVASAVLTVGRIEILTVIVPSISEILRLAINMF